MILLTGASGYLGRHVLAKVYQRGLHATMTSRSGRIGEACNLADPNAADLFLRRIQPTVVIHCACVVPKSSADHYLASMCEGLEMVENIAWRCGAQIVFASSHVAAQHDTPYARGKAIAEGLLLQRNRGDAILRLPGLFGLPRTSGSIYGAAKSGVIPDSFGPYPAMHVEDAAEYLVRAATMPSDGKPEPFSVTYGEPRLVACYGPLGHTFDSRVQALIAEVRA